LDCTCRFAAERAKQPDAVSLRDLVSCGRIVERTPLGQQVLEEDSERLALLLRRPVFGQSEWQRWAERKSVLPHDPLGVISERPALRARVVADHAAERVVDVELDHRARSFGSGGTSS